MLGSEWMGFWGSEIMLQVVGQLGVLTHFDVGVNVRVNVRARLGLGRGIFAKGSLARTRAQWRRLERDESRLPQIVVQWQILFLFEFLREEGIGKKQGKRLHDYEKFVSSARKIPGQNGARIRSGESVER